MRPLRPAKDEDFDHIRSWVDEAVTAGGKGGDLLHRMPGFDEQHMGTPCGADCLVAFRQSRTVARILGPPGGLTRSPPNYSCPDGNRANPLTT
jgi:hypothetical protein